MGTCCLSYQFYFDWPVTEKNARAIAKKIPILGTTSSRSEVTVLTLQHQCQARWIQLPLHNQRHLLHQIGGPLVNAAYGILDSDVAHLNDLHVWNQWPLNQGKVVRCNGPLLGHWFLNLCCPLLLGELFGMRHGMMWKPIGHHMHLQTEKQSWITTLLLCIKTRKQHKSQSLACNPLPRAARMRAGWADVVPTTSAWLPWPPMRSNIVSQ